MLRRACNGSRNALVPVHQKRTALEIMSTWSIASWGMMWHWNFLTFFPLVTMDLARPSVVANKLTLTHFFHEKKQDAKLQRVFDKVVTEWTDDLDNGTINAAISRTFL